MVFNHWFEILKKMKSEEICLLISLMGLDHSIIVLQTNSFYIFIFIFSTKYVFVIFFILVQTRSSACASLQVILIIF
jgi:hypothetical protein